MVAAHLSQSYIATGKGAEAVAAGVNLMLSPRTTAAAQAAAMLSPAGRCQTLDAAADGYVRAEACVVLKIASLIPNAPSATSTCIVLCGSCVNQVCVVGIHSRAKIMTRQGEHQGHLGLLLRNALATHAQDGRSSSLTAPNGPSQQAVIGGALVEARMTPENVAGLEMHGTGTALGDPIEVGAALTVCRGPPVIRLTAAKSQAGHAESAAGE